MKYQEIVTGISDCAAVTIGGKEYTGSYLAMIVAMNPNIPTKEAAETPQLICELGRLTAIAYRAKQEADVLYRMWRDGTVHRLTNDLVEADKAGFACVMRPGKDAKGKDKPPKLPSTAAVETYLRTLPEYPKHYGEMQRAEEAWSVMHTALEAAKQRTWVVRTLVETGAIAESKDSLDDNEDVSDVSESTSIGISEGRTRRPPPPPVVRR